MLCNPNGKITMGRPFKSRVPEPADASSGLKWIASPKKGAKDKSGSCRHLIQEQSADHLEWPTHVLQSRLIELME